MGSVQRDHRGSAWHGSIPGDLAAYAFSWAPIVAYMWLAGGMEAHGPLVFVFLLTTTVNFAHRHFAYPYAFLDRDVFRRHRLRLVVAPLLALFASGFVVFSYGFGQRRAIFGVIMGVGAVINIWHFGRQKYGILRMYQARAASLGYARGASSLSDHLIIYGWIPFLAAVSASRWVDYPPAFPGLNFFKYTNTIRTVAALSELLVWPAFALSAYILYRWLRQEFRQRTPWPVRLPRLSLVAGAWLAGAALLVVHPVVVFLAWGFNHGVEYMVFVSRFQRARYASREPNVGPAFRAVTVPLLRSPVLTASLIALVCIVPYMLIRYPYYIDSELTSFLGVSTFSLIAYYSATQQMVHFHMDSYLWKVRQHREMNQAGGSEPPPELETSREAA